jgi:hypothetical protein
VKFGVIRTSGNANDDPSGAQLGAERLQSVYGTPWSVRSGQSYSTRTTCVCGSTVRMLVSVGPARYALSPTQR